MKNQSTLLTFGILDMRQGYLPWLKHYEHFGTQFFMRGCWHLPAWNSCVYISGIICKIWVE